MRWGAVPSQPSAYAVAARSAHTAPSPAPLQLASSVHALVQTPHTHESPAPQSNPDSPPLPQCCNQWVSPPTLGADTAWPQPPSTLSPKTDAAIRAPQTLRFIAALPGG